MASQNYDPDSGQVYTETIMRRDCSDRTPWEFQCRAEMAKLTSTRLQTGVRSLKDLCMEKLIDHANKLLPETLQNLPDTIAMKIWAAMRREWRESFHVWTAFINAGFKAPNFKHALQIKHLRRVPLVDTFIKLSSGSCAWMVDLTLSNVSLSAGELKEISRLVNLQNLHIQYRCEGEGQDLDNRIVNVWSTRAQIENAFAHLEQLSIFNAPYITSDVFEHLSGFPVLFTFICSGSYRKRDFQKVEQSGWKVERLVHQAEETKYSYRSCVGVGRDRSASQLKELSERQRQRKPKSPSSVPVVDAQLGILGRAHFGQPLNMLCFQRDQEFSAPTQTEPAKFHGRPRKQRKLDDAKGADFAAMLNGG